MSSSQSETSAGYNSNNFSHGVRIERLGMGRTGFDSKELVNSASMWKLLYTLKIGNKQ